jgi:hypothetical protein
MKKTLILLFVLCAFIIKSSAADTTKISIQVGGGSKFSAINVVDKVTGNFVSATITNVSVQNLNAELATVTLSDPTTVKLTPIKGGNGIAVVNCHLEYVDPGDGLQKSEDKAIVISYTVIAAAHGVSLLLTF